MRKFVESFPRDYEGIITSKVQTFGKKCTVRDILTLGDAFNLENRNGNRTACETGPPKGSRSRLSGIVQNSS
jgi:hypothetical protein